MNRQLLKVLVILFVLCISFMLYYTIKIEPFEPQNNKFNNPNILPFNSLCQDADGNLRYKGEIINSGDPNIISLYYGNKNNYGTGFYVTKTGKVYYSNNLNKKFDKIGNLIGETRMVNNSNQGNSIFPPICTIGKTINNYDIYINDKPVGYTGHMLYYFMGVAVIQNLNGTIFACQNLGTYRGTGDVNAKWISVGNVYDNNATIKTSSDNIIVMQYGDAPPIAYSLNNNCPIYPSCKTNDKINEIVCNGKKTVGDLFYQNNDNSGCIINSDNKSIICSNNLFSSTWIPKEQKDQINPICYIDNKDSLKCVTSNEVVSYNDNIPKNDKDAKIVFFMRTDYNAGIIIINEPKSNDYNLYITPALHAVKVIWRYIGGIDPNLRPSLSKDIDSNLDAITFPRDSSSAPITGIMISNWVTVQRKDYIPFTFMFPIE